jgi:hypothetical protein
MIYDVASAGYSLLRLNMFSKRISVKALTIGGCYFCLFLGGTAAADPPVESYGLVAHWTFDRNFSSSVNNTFYGGTPHGGARVRIDRSSGVARVGNGALRINSAPKSGNPSYVAIPNPPWGLNGNAVFTVSGWFKLSDLAGDGMDTRNFVWESVPNSSFAFSLNSSPAGKIALFRFRSENYRSFQEAAYGPATAPNTWRHVATVWNTRALRPRVRRWQALPRDADERCRPAGAHSRIPPRRQ